jgi:hypothetical protein
VKRVKKRASRNKGTVMGDPVALEREDMQHWLLEKAIVDLCAARGIRTLTNKHVDLLVQADSVSIIFEMKACGPTGIGRPVRQAIYQLLEYRYLYRDKLTADVRLCVVAERRPRGGDDWLVGYMEHLGIGIVWRNAGDEGLGCSEPTKTLLVDVLPQVAEWPPEPILKDWVPRPASTE